MYWSDEEDLEEDLQKPHWYQHGPDELTIEATAYALLVSIKQAVTEIDVEPVAEWIIRQRGTNGAFVGALVNKITICQHSQPNANIVCKRLKSLQNAFKIILYCIKTSII